MVEALSTVSMSTSTKNLFLSSVHHLERDDSLKPFRHEKKKNKLGQAPKPIHA
jgi:hypothetical protein